MRMQPPPRSGLSMSRLRTLVPPALLVALVAVLPSCGGSGDGPLVMAGETLTDGYQVRLLSEPSPVPLNEPFELVVEVRDKSGEAAQDISLEVTGWMPGHGHGMLRTTEILPIGKGLYRVRGMLFHMGGQWEIRVAVAWEERSEDFFQVKRDGVTFPVEL